MKLEGKVAIVTGGDTGIGRAISLAFAGEGARVVVDYRGDGGTAEALIAEIHRDNGTACAFQADVANAAEVGQLVDQAVRAYGGLDILVNNAGIEEKHPFLETPLDAFDRVLSVNLVGTWLCSQAAARQMARQRRGGRIINISSVHEEVAMPTNAPYCAAKGGIKMLMRTIAVELARHRITVNDICPGAIDTPMDANIKLNAQASRALMDEIPLRRMGKPEEVAALAVYLAGDEAAYVTGASYFIDGGMSQQSGSL